MIVFTINSIGLLLDALKSADFSSQTFIFNDGFTQHHVKELLIRYEEFEVSGMYQQCEVGYQFNFHNGAMMAFTFTNGLIVVQSCIQIDKDKIQSMPSEVAQYYL